ncbi:MAG: 16S rRNA (adenine(1518)-N(6)/adenine(1519)-N(6))-dimethyltransferase RsmA [Candidatus Paceibacterota bacterium]
MTHSIKTQGHGEYHRTMKAKKSLGQNFLKSEPALRKIVEAGEVGREDVILEIGPGKGALTKKLLEQGGQVIAIEKDRELFEFLKTKFVNEVNSGSLVLVHEDILQFSISNFQLSKYKIIANIPYNITGAILKKFLTSRHQPERMVLMVQKEVAHRIVGRHGPSSAKSSEGKKESLLSISVKAYGVPRLVMKVPARYFSPSPKVDSVVIAITDISRKIFEETDTNEEKFWEIVRLGFAHKRKKLSGNLKSMNFGDEEAFVSVKNKRAEDLSLFQWISLAKIQF